MENKTFKKVFQFGKVNAGNGNAKRNLVELEVELRIQDNKPVFSVCGSVWNATHRDVIQCGQCVDDVYNEFKSQLRNRKDYETIMKLWEKWHLNNMHGGCVHQRAEKWEDVLLDDSKPKTQDNMAIWTYPEDNAIESIGRKILDSLHGTAYKIARKIIKVNVWADNRHKKGLLTKPCPVCGYKYGTAWLYEPIEAQDLKTICELLEISPEEQLEIIRLQEEILKGLLK